LSLIQFSSVAIEIRCLMNWREHLAAVLGAIIILACVVAVAMRPLIVGLVSIEFTTRLSTTVAKTPAGLKQ
jgi:hypothetical protein